MAAGNEDREAAENVIRACKKQEYRAGLGEAERAPVPENSAGLGELSDAELGQIAGGDAIQRKHIGD
jgi:mersacidin/lichenicidin family type 2 lantibiotic